MTGSLRTAALIAFLIPQAVPAGAQSTGTSAQAPQAAPGVDAAELLRRIDLVRQHYTSSRVSGAQQELSTTLDLVRAARAAGTATSIAGGADHLPQGGRDVPMPGLLRRIEPEYPIEAARKGITGHVVVDVVIDTSGIVRDARIAHSVPDLDRAALDAVRQWRFAKPRVSGAPADIAATLVLAFTLGRDAPPVNELDLARFYVERADFTAAEPALARALETITREAACIAAVSTAAAAQRRAGAAGFEPPRKIRDVKPVYPALARKARVTGVVAMEAVIDENGRVTCARVLKSIPLLDQAALDVVSQWEFSPARRAGVPVPLRLTMTVNFTLQ
jgi:TonB family protein